MFNLYSPCVKILRLLSIIFVIIILYNMWYTSFVWAQQTQDIQFEVWDVYTPAQSGSTPIKIASPSAVALDTINGRILYSKNAFTKRQMASTVKMMTAILAIEAAKLDDIVKVSKRAAYVGGSQAHLKAGEEIRMQHLLYALMLPSGNDAAIAIAEHIGGSVEEFIGLMDAKAKQIGAKNTKYGSPHGLDRNNYSTAYDLALIARYCLQNPVFSEIVKTKHKTIPREGIAAGKEYRNTNQLLFTYEGADGVKTGYTGPAGKCLVASATRSNWQVVSVVLGASSSQRRFGDSRKILDYVFNYFPLITILPDAQRMVSIPVVRGKRDKVFGVNKGEISMHLSETELAKVERDFIIPQQLNAPIQKGQIIGKVVLRLGDNIIGTRDLYADQNIGFWTIDMNLKKILYYWIGMRELMQNHE